MPPHARLHQRGTTTSELLRESLQAGATASLRSRRRYDAADKISVATGRSGMQIRDVPKEDVMKT